MTLGDVFHQYPSSLIAISISFAFLWLSLYIFRINPDDTVSKLASGALFIVFMYQLSGFLISTTTSISDIIMYHRVLWWLPLAPVLWLHLSQRKPVSASILGVFYGIAVSFILVGIFTNTLFDYAALRHYPLPLKDEPLPSGPVYLLCVAFMFLTSLIAFINSLPALRKQLWLSLGALIFMAVSVGLFVQNIEGVWINHVFGNIVLDIGMLVVAITILRYKALLNKEVLERDAIYVAVGALGITGIYALALIFGQGGVSNIPIALLAVITALALSTHMLADILKVSFSKLIGTRLGLLSMSDVDKMEQLYHEASRVKRQQGPAIELFNDGNKTVEQLLDLLTPRQREIITLRAKGLSDKQIADALDIKLPTVRKHIEDIKNRVGTRDKADCAVYCVVTGLLSKDDLVDWFDALTFNHIES